jgi:tRNA-2-methylthio-N6-dimethylallyladenosine synthase
LCPHIHIPFQSWSDAVLKKMFRGYSAQQCYDFIDKIRGLKRPISITTDIILWFPGETDADFEETLKLTEYGRFDMIYMGIYSNRPWTFADKKYPDDIPYKVKHERWKKLNDVLYRISEENNKAEVWNIRKVMINEKWNKWERYWVTDNMKQIVIKWENEFELWDMADVKIDKWVVFKLEWKIVK